MIANKVVGALTQINETEHISIRDGKTLDKKTCLVTTKDKYPQTIEVEFTGNNEHLLNEFGEGQQVVINVNIRSRSWESPEGKVKYFTSLSGWKIEAHNVEQPELPENNDNDPF